MPVFSLIWKRQPEVFLNPQFSMELDGFKFRGEGAFTQLTLLSMLVVSAFVTRAFYNLYLHPLSSYDGPAHLAFSGVPLAWTQLRGTTQYMLERTHRKYGSVVRISPNTLSYIEPQAWQEIYGLRKGYAVQAVLPKDPDFYSEMLLPKDTITISSDDDAAPIRRAINPGFAPRALLDLEPMLHSHVQLFMSQIDQKSQQQLEGGSMDLQKWFTFSMFDITSDFVFGEDLGCVRTGSYHEWVQFVLSVFYASTLLHQCHKFWPLNRLLALLIPFSVRKRKAQHDAASLRRVRRRMARASTSSDRPDFMHHFLRQAEKESLPLHVIESQASVVILAGSETSAVALTAAVYEVLSAPEIYDKLRDEVRGSFSSADQVDLRSVLARLPYLNAVIKETLRMHTPLANGFMRVVPREREVRICGRLVPPSTRVTINHYAANRSPRNFRNPHTFTPARWLGDPDFDEDRRSVVQPFSVGPRDCPGKSFATYIIHFMLAHLIWNFDLELGPGLESWAVGQKIYNGWMQPPLPVILRKRN